MPDDSTLIVKHHGLPWKRTADATVGLEEFLDAKARFIHILDDHDWNANSGARSEKPKRRNKPGSVWPARSSSINTWAAGRR